MNIQKNINLSQYTTFKIGGPAKFFISVSAKEELSEAIAWAKAEAVPYFILGGGSNLLVSDSGFDGLIIKINNQDIEQDGNFLLAGAGARLSDLVAMSESACLTGLEWATGIPGSVGGAIRGNAGAYGQEIKNSLKSVEIFDTSSEQFVVLPIQDINFDYRHSDFKNHPEKIIWSANFELKLDDSDKIISVIKDILDKRLRLPRHPSAGCVFKNISFDSDLLKKVSIVSEMKGNKIPCAILIETLGLKGQQIGDALISQEHANFIVNTNQATAEDVKALIELIKQKVLSEYDLVLEEEIQYL
jgi:UDP-N-acetylmuramate dehydrogenase